MAEDFESGSKAGYATGTVELKTGEWMLDDALLGNLDGDRKNGEQSVRLRDGKLEMLFDFDDGADEVSFVASNSGFTNDTGGVISLHYSTDEGDTWQQAGNNTEMTDQLEPYSISVNISQPVRFRIAKEAGGRINIDDFFITPFQELANQPLLEITVSGSSLSPGDLLDLPIVNPNQSSKLDLRIRNGGEPDLNVSEIILSGSDHSAFTLSSSLEGVIEGGESVLGSLQFHPSEAGEFSAEITFNSNDPDQPEYRLMLSAESIDENSIIPIKKAYDVRFGTRVSIAGRVSAGDEFGGPAHFQDQTGGFAVFESELTSQIVRGDSIRVSGPVTEFNPINGTPGTFLRQIAPTDDDNKILFEIFDVDRVNPHPENISIADLNSGMYESKLVRLEGVSIEERGLFSGDTSYTIEDDTGTAQLRIDGNVESLIDALIPGDPIDITGVVDRFNGVYQIKPRDNQDLKAESFTPEGEDIDKDLTFDVVTWNIEWFGSDGNGPANNDLQMNNVIRIIEEIDADVYAFQEIASQTEFYSLVDSLELYRGFTSTYGQTQQTAYLFKPTVVDSLDSGLLFDGQDSFDWAGRLPLYFEVEVTVDGRTRQIFLYNIHAKAFGDQPSYNRRLSAANSLKAYLDDERMNDRVIFLGDYNDELTKSTYEGADSSPYRVFLEDEFYKVLTLQLEEQGFVSYVGSSNRSFLDHITINELMAEYHIDGAQRVESVSYVDDFFNTTSDHAPVWTRFQFTGEAVELPNEIVVEPNYPNPFNPSTIIPFTLPESTEVSLDVFDILGRKVASPVRAQTFAEGDHEISFVAAGLSSGVYIYRIRFGDGTEVTEKMMLVK
ncbi:choice-of-anchor D domain-containing protein [Rhodohalobacter halophilus]|uniref:choice-of-anchor D domain-containing protein n=1 Tax=Rhodohalobacter halophilus TaxID=1812810 RepID=UPI00159F2A58|nr:choice-of-anchor D domain-containing protein [Rhodohalobacter halophilus]